MKRKYRYAIVKTQHDIVLFFERVFRVLKFNNLRSKVSRLKHKIVLEYMEFFFAEIIKKYKNLSNEEQNLLDINNIPIWICWFQGSNNMPPLIKSCVNSIKNTNPKRSIILIDDENMNKYVNISQDIKEKVKEKKISYAHYSDILRINLLNNWGGLWMDSTLFCLKQIPDYIFELPLYTGVKQDKNSIPKSFKDLFISSCQWSGFLCGSKYKKSVLFSFMSECLDHYWKNHNSLLTYLFIDYLIFLAIKNISEVEDQFKNVPINNDDIYYLTKELLNSEYNKDILNEIQEDTFVCKLSRHYEYCTDINGKKTLYKKIIDGEL